MRLLDGFCRLALPRWPTVLVAPAFAYVGYTIWQVVGLTVLTVVLTELAFAFVKVLVLDRE